MGKINSRAKGKVGEADAARKLRELGFTGARRSAQYCGTAGDADLADAVPSVHLEVKRVECLSIYAAVEQAVRDAKPDHIPVVLHRRNHKDWLLIVRLDDMADLARRWVVPTPACPPATT